MVITANGESQVFRQKCELWRIFANVSLPASRAYFSDEMLRDDECDYIMKRVHIWRITGPVLSKRPVCLIAKSRIVQRFTQCAHSPVAFHIGDGFKWHTAVNLPENYHLSKAGVVSKEEIHSCLSVSPLSSYISV